MVLGPYAVSWFAQALGRLCVNVYLLYFISIEFATKCNSYAFAQ